MQTLGLSSKPQPTDNIFKRLFWPAIESQYDVDLLGQQGFWVCTIVAVMSLVMMVASGTPISGILTATTFFLGGCGVRQRSITTSILVSLLYLINFVGGIILGAPGNPVIQLIVLMLLVANIRATVLSRRWMNRPVDQVDQELPERSLETLGDKFSNKLPVRLWSFGRFIFFPLAEILLLLTIVGVAVMEKRASARRYESPASSTQELEVSPR